jgi:hypothetical protein
MSRATNGERFIALSAALTAFPEIQLRGTGQAELYYATAEEMAGQENLVALLDTFAGIAAEGEERDRLLRRDILSDDRLGPLARNLLKLWFVGTWYQLPRDWRERFGGSPRDRDHVPSPQSYTEGLLWPAVGANPSGAKPFGYGMWAKPPRVTLS